jgi:hypothetical protein
MSTPAPAPPATPSLDKHLIITPLVNCMQNVVFTFMLFFFLEAGMFYRCLATKFVSPMDSWPGLPHNMWYSMIIFGIVNRDNVRILLDEESIHNVLLQQ